LLLYRRLSRIIGKIERLVARFEAGRLWRNVARTVAVTGDLATARVKGAAGVGGEQVWPCRFGWLVRMAAYRAAVFGEQLRTVLGQEEMVALLAAAPQAARILRPVCRMLAVETSHLRPRPVAGLVEETAPSEASVVDVAVRKRARTPRAAVDFGRIPLPRGVLAAARRQGFGKVV
jgi:hypothetical protein